MHYVSSEAISFGLQIATWIINGYNFDAHNGNVIKLFNIELICIKCIMVECAGDSEIRSKIELLMRTD